MINIDIESSLHRNDTLSFLCKTKFSKFNLWPNINDDTINNYLFKQLENIQKTGKIFKAIQNIKY